MAYFAKNTDTSKVLSGLFYIAFRSPDDDKLSESMRSVIANYASNFLVF